MSSLAADTASDHDLPLEEVEGYDYMHGLPDQEEEEEEQEENQEEQEDYNENSSLQLNGEDTHAGNQFATVWILVAREARLYSLAELQEADILPPVSVTGALDDPTVVEALKTVEAPADGRDCPICLQDDEGEATAAAGVWKETPCGHRFHGRCVERWLQAQGSCPMCRHQVVTKPTTPDTNSVASLHSALVDIFEAYGQDVVTELQQQLPL